MFTSSLIHRAHQLTTDSEIKDETSYNDKVSQLLAFNKSHKGKNLLIPLNFYLGLMEDTELALIPFMDEAQKQDVLRTTQVTYLLLLAEKKYEIEHQKTENIDHYNEQLKKCRNLIDTIQYKAICEEMDILPAPDQGHQSEEQPVAYLGLFAGYIFAYKMQSSTSGSITKQMIVPLDSVNGRRLYWAWSSAFIKTILGLLPPDYFFANQAQQSIRYPDLYTGTMSWGLYFFRFSLNLGLLMKHTVAGPWMSKEERSESWTERFKTQIQQRKFTLLNDFFWGIANALCFFLLYGKGALGAAGDLMTIALLGMDISLAVWDFEEQRTQHNQQMEDYDEALYCLKLQKADLIEEQKVNPDDLLIPKELIELELQIASLERARMQCAREWSYKKYGLSTNIVYALGLLMAFVLLTAPFCPFPAGALAAMTLSGAVLCFAFSVIYNAVKGGIELYKIRSSATELKVEYDQKIAAFKDFVAINADDRAKKLLFLEIKKLAIDSKRQEEAITLQTIKLMHSVLIESLIPPLVFVSLVFLPLGAGLAILASAVGFSMSTHCLIDALFKPEKEELAPFNEEEYQRFCDDPDNWNKNERKTSSFFKLKKTDSVVSEQTLMIEEQTNLIGK